VDDTLLALVVLGALAEFIAIVLGWQELRARVDALRALESARTRVAKSIGTAWENDTAAPLPREGASTDERVDFALARIEALRAEVKQRQIAGEKRLADSIASQVSDSSTALSERIQQLRDHIVEGKRGNRKAAAALVCLVVGMALQTSANIVAIVAKQPVALP
jgi:hypothetical protein